MFVGGFEFPNVVSVVGVDVTHRGSGNDPNVCCSVKNPIEEIPVEVRCCVYSVGVCAHAIANAVTVMCETFCASDSACCVRSSGVDVPTT